jgi:hypothetical protein
MLVLCSSRVRPLRVPDARPWWAPGVKVSPSVLLAAQTVDESGLHLSAVYSLNADGGWDVQPLHADSGDECSSSGSPAERSSARTSRSGGLQPQRPRYRLSLDSGVLESCAGAGAGSILPGAAAFRSVVRVTHAAGPYPCNASAEVGGPAPPRRPLCFRVRRLRAELWAVGAELPVTQRLVSAGEGEAAAPHGGACACWAVGEWDVGVLLQRDGAAPGSGGEAVEAGGVDTDEGGGTQGDVQRAGRAGSEAAGRGGAGDGDGDADVAELVDLSLWHGHELLASSPLLLVVRSGAAAGEAVAASGAAAACGGAAGRAGVEPGGGAAAAAGPGGKRAAGCEGGDWMAELRALLAEQPPPSNQHLLADVGLLLSGALALPNPLAAAARAQRAARLQLLLDLGSGLLSTALQASRGVLARAVVSRKPRARGPFPCTGSNGRPAA